MVVEKTNEFVLKTEHAIVCFRENSPPKGKRKFLVTVKSTKANPEPIAFEIGSEDAGIIANELRKIVEYEYPND